MIAFITCKSNLIPLLEGLCSSNTCRFEFSGLLSFCWNRTNDLGINIPALLPSNLFFPFLAAVQWQNPIFPASKHVFPPEFCHCAAGLQTQVPKLCTDLDLSFLYILICEHIASSLGKIISQRSAFAFCSPARALAISFPRQDYVYKTFLESFHVHI